MIKNVPLHGQEQLLVETCIRMMQEIDESG